MKTITLSAIVLVLLAGCQGSQTNSSTTTIVTKPADTVVAAPPPVAESNGIPTSGDQPAQFVPAGYFIQYTATGDLNNDQLEDVALVLREIADSTSARALVVLTQQRTGPRYRLADAGWKAIGPQCREDGYAFHDTEDLSISDGNLELKLYDPGPFGNLFTTYRIIDGAVQLTTLETFGQGAGGASGRTHHLLSGLIEQVEINRMKDPEETAESTEHVAPQQVLLHDSNPYALTELDH